MKRVRQLVVLGVLCSVWMLACRMTSDAPAPERLSSSVQLAAEDEPGAAMIVTGRVVAADAATPLAGARLRVYQTDDTGYYRRGPLGLELGQARARLSAWLVTDEDGRFEIRSIRPAGYPGERDAAHLHVDLRAEGYPPQEHTLYFEGDERLTDELRHAVREDGRGDVLWLVPDEHGLLRCEWALRAVEEDGLRGSGRQ